jgi:hypothetical protein
MKAAVDPHNHDGQMENSRRNIAPIPNARETVTCFYCRKKRPLQSKCSLGLRHQSNPGSAARKPRPSLGARVRSLGDRAKDRGVDRNLKSRGALGCRVHAVTYFI